MVCVVLTMAEFEFFLIPSFLATARGGPTLKAGLFSRKASLYARSFLVNNRKKLLEQLHSVHWEITSNSKA